MSDIYENPWLYQGLPFTNDMIKQYIGFVYLITNLTNGRKYIGKKIFRLRVARKLKTRKNRKITRKDSDWKTYYGSSPSLKEDVNELGPLAFKREILHLCSTKTEANYLEAKEIFLRGCLETADDYYNQWVSTKVIKTRALTEALNKKGDSLAIPLNNC